MSKISRLVLVYFLILTAGAASSFAQFDKFKHFIETAKPSKLKVEKGEEFTIRLFVEFEKTWYTYSLEPQVSDEGIGPTTTEIVILSEDMLEMAGDIKAPKPKVKYDKGFEMDVGTFSGKFHFDIPVKALKDINFEEDEVKIEFYLQQCDPKRCLPPSPFEAIIKSEAFDPTEVYSDVTEAGEESSDSEEDNTEAAGTMTEEQEKIEKAKEEGVFSFLWLAMAAGAAALLTPCVFPMIPITVSFFTKRSEKRKGKGVLDASVYALGIILTFTLIGFLFGLIAGPTGIADFAASAWANLFIAAIFIVFALNLFGAFEIQIPTSILNKLNAKSQGGGFGGILLMGLTFSLTSFTCTVPFVGTSLISASTGGELFYPAIGMLGFSAVFAAPFFLLALFPSAMNKLPKSGGWMNNIKVVMGFLEIAAAMKFISGVDLAWSLGIMPREIFLAVWIGISILVALYILGFFRLKLDSQIDRIGAPRAVFSIFFMSIAFYLLSGLYGKSMGELDAFLPPKDYEMVISSGSIAQGDSGPPPEIGEAKNGLASADSDEGSPGESDESWYTNYDEALAAAKSQNKPLFVDFTGVNCSNCRLMESTILNKAQVQSRLGQMIKAKLYTDRRIDADILNRKLQLDKLNSVDIPLHVILTPDEELIASKAFTRSVEDYVKFLDKGLNADL